jgi:hypothetical protein
MVAVNGAAVRRLWQRWSGAVASGSGQWGGSGGSWRWLCQRQAEQGERVECVEEITVLSEERGKD